MTFPILGANSAVGGYAIDNSLRFNDDDSAYLSRTPASAGDRKTWTWSGWVKRGNLGSGLYTPFSFGDNSTGGSDVGAFSRLYNDILYFSEAHGGVNSFYLETSQVFRDTSAWYHFVFAIDTTQATASDRIKIYVNGVQITSFASSTYPSLNFDTSANQSGQPQHIGVIDVDGTPSGQYFDGYMAEINFIDGQALSPTDFGEFDEDSGIWKPIRYSGSYGNNGYYLDFGNSGSLGADQSGNGNNFTPTNLASTDQTTDTPTNNFATMNVLDKGTQVDLSEGNLAINWTGVTGHSVRSTMAMSTGKWYCEFRKGYADISVGLIKPNIDGVNTSWVGASVYGAEGSYGYTNLAQKRTNGSSVSYGATYASGDIIGIAFDADGGTLEFYKNGVSQGTAFTGISGEYCFAIGYYGTGNSTPYSYFNAGNDSSFAGNETRQNNSDGNGYGDFYYAPPSGYLALCTQNLATELSPTIDDGSLYQNQVLYTGNSGTQSITGVGFQPDLVWIKARNQTYSHRLIDSTRGVDKGLRSSDTSAETTVSGALTSFDSDGFSLGFGTSETNNSAGNYVAWNWLANGGTTSSNTDGSITSTVQANTTAGFSIITWTGSGANATIGHGLNQAPEIVFFKDRGHSIHWVVEETVTGSLGYLKLNTTDARATTFNNVFFNSTAPTSSLIHIGEDGAVNWPSSPMVAYAFHSVEGYSKFGSYTGNGSSDGTFVYTGFRPSFVMIKRTSDTGHWYMRDDKRDNYNPNDAGLYANLSNAEADIGDVDFLSNGFKLKNTFSEQNQSGQTYIYACFSANPFVTSSGVPVVAR